jgi:hypothetical protein
MCIFIIDFATRHAKCIDKPLQIGMYDLFQMQVNPAVAKTATCLTIHKLLQIGIYDLSEM